MREIKFRAWDLVDMVENVSIHEHYWFTVVNGERGSYYDFETYPIMQYTGLKDKNGKEIYEGDILNTNTSTDVVVPYYVKEALPFIQLVNKTGWVYDNGDYYEGLDIMSHQWKKFEVIGNIYENPELLK